MKTNEQILKIRATLLYILRCIPEGVDYIKLFKILYYAQQSHLVEYGRVLVEDSFYAQKHGPVPSFLYKALKGFVSGDKLSADISACVEGVEFRMVDGTPVFTTRVDYDRDEFSVSDLRCLDKSISENRHIDSYILSEKSHEDRAWIEANKRYTKDPELGNKMTSIEIARAGNAGKGMIDYIRENQFIDKALFLYQ
jgi:uncharacterized phage-associated protein